MRLLWRRTDLLPWLQRISPGYLWLTEQRSPGKESQMTLLVVWDCIKCKGNTNKHFCVMHMMEHKLILFLNVHKAREYQITRCHLSTFCLNTGVVLPSFALCFLPEAATSVWVCQNQHKLAYVNNQFDKIYSYSMQPCVVTREIMLPAKYVCLIGCSLLCLRHWLTPDS